MKITRFCFDELIRHANYFLACAGLVLLQTPTLATSLNGKMKVRPSAVTGKWYPADPEALKISTKEYLRLASLSPSSTIYRKHRKVAGLILPHAGHKFCGRTCAIGVDTVRGQTYSRLIIIGPAHYSHIQGAVLPTVTHFHTPLGNIPVDQMAVRTLSDAGVTLSDHPHTREHCIETLLPFFQIALDKFQIVPILIGSLSDTDRKTLADQLSLVYDDSTLVVASSDFVHYGSEFDYMPEVGTDIQAGVRKIDEEAIRYILSLNADGLLEYHRQTGATICGIMPIALLLGILPERTQPKLLGYNQSADVTGDTDVIVSYAALAFYKSTGDREKVNH